MEPITIEAMKEGFYLAGLFNPLWFLYYLICHKKEYIKGIIEVSKLDDLFDLFGWGLAIFQIGWTVYSYSRLFGNGGI